MRLAEPSPTAFSRPGLRAVPSTASPLAVKLVAASVACLPVLIPQLPGNAAPDDFLLIAAVGALLVWAASTGSRIHVPYVMPMGVLLGSGALAALLGHYPARGALALGQDVLVLIWCGAVATVGLTASNFRLIIKVWAVSATLWSALLILAAAAALTGVAGMSTSGGRAALTFGSPNTAATYFSVSFMVLLASPWPRRVIPLIVSSGLILGALVLTGSIAGMGGLLVGGVVATVVAIYRRRGPIHAVAGFVVLTFAGALLAFVAVQAHLVEQAQASSSPLIRNSVGRSERSSSTHSGQLKQVFDLFWTNPPVGIGPASTKSMLEAQGAITVKEAHDDYTATVVERGIFGAIGLALLIGAVVFRAAHMVRVPSPGTAGMIRSTAPLVGALVAVGFASLSHEVLHFRHVWVLFGLIAALTAWGREGTAAGGAT
jgi:hypothetical protein